MKDITEPLEKIPLLVAALSNVLETPIGWLIFLCFLVWLAWLLFQKDFSKIFDLLERKNAKRLEHLNYYIGRSELTDNETFSALKDMRDAYYFKIATGIYAEYHLRHALISLHQNIPHLVSWKQIRRAMPFLNINSSGEVSVRELDMVEKFGYRFNQFAMGMCLLSSVLIFTLFFFAPIKSPSTAVLWLGGALFMLMLALFAASQNWPVYAAATIRKGIEVSNSAGDQMRQVEDKLAIVESQTAVVSN